MQGSGSLLLWWEWQSLGCLNTPAPASARQARQQGTSDEADVWLDDINKSGSRYRLESRPAAVALTRRSGEPLSRMPTLNISPAALPSPSIQLNVSLLSLFCCVCFICPLDSRKRWLALTGMSIKQRCTRYGGLHAQIETTTKITTNIKHWILPEIKITRLIVYIAQYGNCRKWSWKVSRLVGKGFDFYLKKKNTHALAGLEFLARHYCLFEAVLQQKFA